MNRDEYVISNSERWNYTRYGLQGDTRIMSQGLNVIPGAADAAVEAILACEASQLCSSRLADIFEAVVSVRLGMRLKQINLLGFSDGFFISSLRLKHADCVLELYKTRDLLALIYASAWGMSLSILLPWAPAAPPKQRPRASQSTLTHGASQKHKTPSWWSKLPLKTLSTILFCIYETSHSLSIAVVLCSTASSGTDVALLAAADSSSAVFCIPLLVDTDEIASKGALRGLPPGAPGCIGSLLLGFKNNEAVAEE